MKGPLIADTSFALFLAIISFLLLYLFGNQAFEKEQRRKYSLLCDFPFELGGDKPALFTRIPVYGLAVSILLMDSALLFCYPNPDFSHLLVLGILISVLSLLKAIAMAILFHVPAYRFKPHLGLFAAFAGFTALSLVVEALAMMNLGKMAHELLPSLVGLPYVGLGVLTLLALAEFVLLFKPKLADWPKLETEMEEDGTILTKRPKIFVLAATEWATILLGLLGSIVYAGLTLLLALNMM